MFVLLLLPMVIYVQLLQPLRIFVNLILSMILTCVQLLLRLMMIFVLRLAVLTLKFCTTATNDYNIYIATTRTKTNAATINDKRGLFCNVDVNRMALSTLAFSAFIGLILIIQN